MNTGIAARRYLGLHYLIFRDIDRKKKRKLVRFRMRLTAFFEGGLKTLLNHWVLERDKVLRKDHKPQPDTKEHRVQQGIKTTTQGYVSRGLRLV